MVLSEEVNEMISLINIRTTIVSSVIRKKIGGEEAERILSKIDSLCNTKQIHDTIHNKLEMYRVGKRRRI